jgi:glycosyl transferase family 25
MQEPFQYLNEYYDKILVLSLPRLADRIEQLKKNLAGLNYELFTGIDKQDVSLAELKARGFYSTERYRDFYKKPTEISLGMLCCSLGHVKIYEHIIQNGYQKTLILEDDAVVIPGALQHFPSIVKELPRDWELLYLGYEKNEEYGIREKIKRFIYQLFPTHSQLNLTRSIYSRYYPIPVSDHIAKAGFHDCTHAYAITLDGAKKLLQYQQPVGFHPDNRPVERLYYPAQTFQPVIRFCEPGGFTNK